jgi:hypothetical protein
MRLAKPFFRLPLSFDAQQLRAEVKALPDQAWAGHPNEIKGNSSIRLISVNGGENDDVNGVMLPTPHLQRSPYLRQVLASFGVVWSRSRLLRLAPGADVPEHADINYHWFNRVRVHIPIITQPPVRFYCGDQSVHMQAGEAWVFDNWRLHRVENPTDHERIHLVADTSGNSTFWSLVAQSDAKALPSRALAYRAGEEPVLRTERTVLAPIMTPGELDFLLLDLRSELAPKGAGGNITARLAQYHALLDSFAREWRQLYALYGEQSDGHAEFIKLRDNVRAASQSISDGLAMRSNGVAAHSVLEGRVLRPAISVQAAGVRPAPARSRTVLRRPVFIVAAPRSGSTLLFETLAASTGVCTLGGEAHWLVENIAELRPGAPGVESNRLIANQATDSVARQIVEQIASHLCDSKGQAVEADGALRFLEKTPKNALRIPFFNRIFPDAQFVFLWRDPRENLSSIIEAWRSGRWKTYNGLAGFDGPWSLLLTPGWRDLNGQSLERIAAQQWEITNRIVLDDLATIPRDRWTTLEYSRFVSQPQENLRRLCDYLHMDVDAALAERVSGPLPHSRYTLTSPDAEKWRANENIIMSVLPSIDATWQRLKALPPA